jgi:acetyl-CoA carboxylase biotin carboxyl carrier protein
LVKAEPPLAVGIFIKAAIAHFFYQMVNFEIDRIFEPAKSSAEILGLFSGGRLTYRKNTNVRVGPPYKQAMTPKEDGMSKQSSDADVAFISALAELLNKNELTEISVKREYGEADSLNVRVVKQSTVVQMAQSAPVQYAAAPAAAAPVVAAVNEDPAQHPGAVTSPMVGTCYMAAEPGASPFVTVGSAVTEGQTVLIIEAMKTMNHIPAPRAGTVKRILVSDGTAVEFGAPLLIIE